MILYMYIASGQRLTAPRGRTFDVIRNILSFRSFVASLKKISLKSEFVYFFMTLYMYSPGAGADSPQGDKRFMSTERPYHFTHLLKVSKTSL